MLRRIRFPKGVLALSGIGTFIGLGALFKDSIGGDEYRGNEQVTGRTIVVTGANTGMGKALSLELAKRGGRIVMACRDLEKCEAARKEIMEVSFNRNVECKKLDLASLKSVREFAEGIIENEKRLDVLVNNAGVMSPPYTLTEDGFEMQLGVNFLGPFLLTNLLLNKLKASKSGCVILTTSMSYSKGEINFQDLNSVKKYHPETAYSQSKLALMLFNVELTKYLEGAGVRSFVVAPNLTKTEIGRHLSVNKSFSRVLLTPLWWYIMLTPRQGIQTTLCCILSPDIQCKLGNYYRLLEEHTPDMKARDEMDARRLWLIAERWTRLKT